MENFTNTKFELAIEGAYGAYRQQQARDEATHMQRFADNGHILVDPDGAAYWETNWDKNGKYLSEDAAEKLSFTDVVFDREATRKARREYSRQKRRKKCSR